jgi:hypothetical protein
MGGELKKVAGPISKVLVDSGADASKILQFFHSSPGKDVAFGGNVLG